MENNFMKLEDALRIVHVLATQFLEDFKAREVSETVIDGESYHRPKMQLALDTVEDFIVNVVSEGRLEP